MDFESKSQWALAWWCDEGRAMLMTRVTPVGAQAAFSFNCVIITTFFSPGEPPFLPHHSGLEQRQMIAFFEIWRVPSTTLNVLCAASSFSSTHSFLSSNLLFPLFCRWGNLAAEARWLARVIHSQHQRQSELTPSVYWGCPEATSCWQPQ